MEEGTDMKKALSIGVVVAMAGTASAQSYNGTNVGGPQWDRPIGAGPTISGLGPVNYDLQPFFVDTAGLYTIDSVQSYDGYLHLYEGVFNANDQLNGLLAGNDDGPGGIGTSRILDIALLANTQYFIVTSAFEAGDEGTFENTVSGAGIATFGIVPAPGGAGVLALGGLAAARRRRA